MALMYAIISYLPSAAYMRQSIWSTLFRMMACQFFGVKPLSKPMLFNVNWPVRETNFSEILTKIETFSFTKMHLNISCAEWRPFHPGRDELFTIDVAGHANVSLSCPSGWLSSGFGCDSNGANIWHSELQIEKLWKTVSTLPYVMKFNLWFNKVFVDAVIFQREFVWWNLKKKINCLLE